MFLIVCINPGRKPENPVQQPNAHMLISLFDFKLSNNHWQDEQNTTCICVSALVSIAMTIICVRLVHYSNMCSTITDLVSLVQWLFRGFSFLLHWIKVKEAIWLYSWLLSWNMFYPFIFQQAFKTVLLKVCFSDQNTPIKMCYSF